MYRTETVPAQPPLSYPHSSEMSARRWLTIAEGTPYQPNRPKLLECVRLRVKDVDFGRNEITVRDRKGQKDRVTILPMKLRGSLMAHL